AQCLLQLGGKPRVGRSLVMRCPRELCLMGSTTWTRPRRLALEPRCIGVAPSRPKLRTNFVTRGPNTSLTDCHWQTFTPPLSALPMPSAGRTRADLNSRDEVTKARDVAQARALCAPQSRQP